MSREIPVPEEKTRRVLLCGGHMDGQWVTMPAREYTFRAVRPQPLGLPSVLAGGDDAFDPLPLDVAEWHLDQLGFSMRTDARLWIGVLTTLYGRHRDEAILRAIFQRDVAQQLLGHR
jgi:hypothetical protein